MEASVTLVVAVFGVLFFAMSLPAFNSKAK
jgi:hypothetical protein